MLLNYWGFFCLDFLIIKLIFIFHFFQKFFSSSVLQAKHGGSKNEGKKRIQDREGVIVDTTCMRHNLDYLIIASDSCKLAATSSTYGTCATHHAL